MADLGARVVLVGIPGDDRAGFKHSTARRKGLSLMPVPPHEAHLSARYRAGDSTFALQDLITHRFDLAQTADAFALNAAYQDGVIKVMVDVNRRGETCLAR